MHTRHVTVLLLSASIIGALGLHYASSARFDAQAAAAASPSTDATDPLDGFPEQVYFGDTHLHTVYSADAGLIGNALGPDDAYRFARGEKVISTTGSPAQLKRPLDFLVISDHAENLGLPPASRESNPELAANPWGKMMIDLFKKGDVPSLTQAYMMWIKQVNALDDPLKTNTSLATSMWQRLTASAEKFNDPGRFTAFIGFEWTLMPDGKNLHRNVIFRDGKEKADQIIPASAYDFQDPEKLWTWMGNYEQKTGGKLLAIPHNGNISNGLMFDDKTLISGEPLNRDYAERRSRWEPLYEVTQIKGDTEAHPYLSPSDELANYERWDKSSFGPEPKTKAMLHGEYAREALKNGLAFEAKLGANPFKFGLIGSTDSHTSLASHEEGQFFGKATPVEPNFGRSKTSPTPFVNPLRFNEALAGRSAPKGFQTAARESSAAGLAAVWASENSRTALWDAMKRKEVYATTGTRMRVRVFAGFDFSGKDLTRADFAKNGYRHGVPMGGNLSKNLSGKSPMLLIQAQRDPDGANLDRVQVVKGWLDAKGGTHEQVFDVVWSDQRKRGADGKLPPVGNTVNVSDASYTNSIGAAELATSWADPSFNAKQKAFYYVRVLEIPTPRWTTYDAKRYSVALPTDVPASIQERAYTSPIWYTP